MLGGVAVWSFAVVVIAGILIVRSSKFAYGKAEESPANSIAHEFAKDEWVWDPDGILVDFLSLVDSPESGMSLFRYCATHGQRLSRDASSLALGLRDMAVMISLRIEEAEGACVSERYASYGECGPEGTHYGQRLLNSLELGSANTDGLEKDGAGQADGGNWTQRLADIGITIEVLSREEAMQELSKSPGFQLNIGQDFS